MSGTSSSQGSSKEYVVRIPKSMKKRYHMMRFNAEHGTDFFKNWSQCRIERENNLKEFKADEDTPKYGAGSEYGRDQREEARRKRFGIHIKKYKPDNQPWLLNVGGKGGKKFRGIREGGVAENAAWFVFMQGKDGSFEAYPIDEWYNFSPVLRYKSLSAEEAEKEFERRDKIMNFFQVMFDKKLKKDQPDPDEEEGKKKGRKKKDLVLSEMDDWVSDDDERDGDEEEDDDEDKPKKKKKATGKKREQGGKKAKQADGASDDDSCLEESDDFDEGAEHDYISGDSSDSDHENDEVARKDLAGVEEGEALKKLLESEESSEEEKKEGEEEEEKEKKEEEVEGGEKKKKKKKKKKQEKVETDKSPENSTDDDSKAKSEESFERKKTVNELKRKAKENPHDIGPETKKMRMDGGLSSSSTSNNAAFGSDTGVTEEAIRRYLMRKPMTTTELLQKFKSKKTGLSSEQLVQSIAQILKRVNPVKQMIKGKMYLSIKT